MGGGVLTASHFYRARARHTGLCRTSTALERATLVFVARARNGRGFPNSIFTHTCSTCKFELKLNPKRKKKSAFVSGGRTHGVALLPRPSAPHWSLSHFYRARARHTGL